MPIRPTRTVRRLRLAFFRLRARCRRRTRSLWRFTGWVWVAAGSLVGFEALELILTGLLAAPEFVPLVLIVLAAAWFFRAGLGRLWTAVRERYASKR
ncbi:MAG TPA: hypothetical protein VN759_01225 [Pseudolysinimonas sp.]|nr:hypothetical protein [Pseudolysinimonas sp.]